MGKCAPNSESWSGIPLTMVLDGGDCVLDVTLLGVPESINLHVRYRPLLSGKNYCRVYCKV